MNPKQDSFIIVASDGLWAVFKAQEAVDYAQSVHQEEVAKVVGNKIPCWWPKPSPMRPSIGGSKRKQKPTT